MIVKRTGESFGTRGRRIQDPAQTRSNTCVMLRSFWLFVVLASSSCYAEVDFHLEKSWAFPETKSTSLILKDTRGEIDGSQVAHFSARSVNVSIASVSSRGTIGGEHHMRQAPILGGPLKTFDASIPAPDVTDRATLVNLAKAAWDAYYPAPSDREWYDLDGVNWVRKRTCLSLTGGPWRHELKCPTPLDFPIWLETWPRWSSWTFVHER